MVRSRAGKVQIATEVDAGLREAAEVRAAQEGLPLSIVVRRALMFHLGVDAQGKPVTRPPAVTPEWEALSAALGQHHVRVEQALNAISEPELRELAWAASELAAACQRRRGAPERIEAARPEWPPGPGRTDHDVPLQRRRIVPDGFTEDLGLSSGED